MISSLDRVSFLSFFMFCISSAFSWRLLRDSNCWSCSHFCLNVWFRLPNSFQFHLWSYSWHLFSLSVIWKFWSPLNGSQANYTTSLHLASLVHIASNKNLFLIGLRFCLLHKLRLKRQWLDMDIEEWKTLAFGNLSTQPSFATILSNLSSVLCSPNLPLHHLKFCPTKPRSIKLHLPRQSLNASIYFASLSTPPSFSSGCKISLKSPKAIHGVSHWARRASRVAKKYTFC